LRTTLIIAKVEAMRGALFILLLCPLLAASALAQGGARPLDAALQSARGEQAAAEAEAARLEKLASQARGDADRLQAQQAAAAQAIEAAEARITTADAELRLASAMVAAHRAQLERKQRPVASLLAGLALMARRPPLLALADRGSTDEFVKVRILLDSTLPAIRRRTRAIAADVAEDERLQDQAAAARTELLRGRKDLVLRRDRFASLERQAEQRSLAAGGKALTVGDVAIAAREEADRIMREQSGGRAARALAETLAAGEALPQRPFAPSGEAFRPPFRYQLPAAAAVSDGLGSVDSSGVRSRGITLETASGSPVAAPADGIVRFSGPFRDFDGVLIIDHGGGWLTLLVNVSSPLRSGQKVGFGDPLGRALGPIQVELSHNGRRFSPALIAGSSQSLSNGAKRG
jgi:septal ring factor EnvC (AmiA/AmiB activator)